MPSFDIVSEANAVELRNAIEQTNKEIGNRFDFKGSDARLEHKDQELTAYADSDFQLEQLKDVMLNKFAKRNVDVRFLDYGKAEKISGDKVKQVIKIKQGIATELAKKIVKTLKDSKLKVQGSIQGESVRVSGAKRDDLQSVQYLFRPLGRRSPGSGLLLGNFFLPGDTPVAYQFRGHFDMTLHGQMSLMQYIALMLAISTLHQGNGAGRQVKSVTMPLKGFK